MIIILNNYNLTHCILRQITADIEKTFKNDETKKGNISYIEQMVHLAHFVFLNFKNLFYYR